MHETSYEISTHETTVTVPQTNDEVNKPLQQLFVYIPLKLVLNVLSGDTSPSPKPLIAKI